MWWVKTGVIGLYVVDVDRCERFVCGGCRQG